MNAALDSINRRLANLERLLSRPQPKVYRVKDIAALLRFSVSQVREMADRIPGKLPGSKKVKLFHARAVDAWIERGMC